MQVTSKSFNLFSFKSAVFLCCLFVLFVSCEREVDIDLKSTEPKLVVQGAIETGYPPYVFLTKSIGFFANIDLNTLQNSFVHSAVVKVSDGAKTIQLKEYSIDTGSNGNKFFFYSIDTGSAAGLMLGELEKFYKLTIEYEGQVYEATTKIPTPTPLDSVLSAYPSPPFNRDKYPNARQIKIVFKDPDTLSNYVQYATQRNNEPMYQGLTSVYSDEIINGTLFTTTMALGEPRSIEFNDTVLINGRRPTTAIVGDTVIFKWSAIDKATYDFWSSYEYSLGTLGNPFSTPIKVKSNISNNALGIWGGYGSTYTKLDIE